MPALESRLALRREATVRVLRAALDLERPDLDTLVAAGVPRWDALDALRLMDAAGERSGGAWVPAARAAYRVLLDSTAPTIATRGGEPLPREKACLSGIDALADHELVALILRTGNGDEDVLALAARLLHDHGGLVGLARRQVEELIHERGLGPAKAAELAAACEIGRRLAFATLRERPCLDSPEAVAALLAPLTASLPHEEMWCLPLDARSRLIGEPRVVSRGDVDGTEAPPRAFLRIALAAGAVSAIAVHNHPSGDPTPSAADAAVTRRLVAACRAVDIPLVDHVVLGLGGSFTSLRRSQPAVFS